jgi:hypothetical protein
MMGLKSQKIKHFVKLVLKTRLKFLIIRVKTKYFTEENCPIMGINTSGYS